MGKIETEVKKRAKKDNLQKIILESLLAVGLVGVAITAPNAIKVLRQLGIIDARNKNSSRSLQVLIRNGYVEFKKDQRGKKHLSITEKGRKKLRGIELSNFKLKKPKNWDGKWRVIIFDIKEKRRKVRDELRIYLNKIGFVRLQDSVWVYPYDCEDLLLLLKADLLLGRSLLYIVADVIENDKHLKEEFGIR
ncbi:MAG: CRISPR-associated endonuclease Cas2 [bacterium]